MKDFLGCMVSITIESKGTLLVFQGLLLDYDDNFCYLDRATNGEVDTALNLNKILAVELFEDTPELIDEVGEVMNEELNDEFEKYRFNDDDDEGKIQ